MKIIWMLFGEQIAGWKATSLFNDLTEHEKSLFSILCSIG